MGVGASRDRPITEGDVRLLTAVGRQIGMAVENARLVEELRHKDDLQQELLDKLIRAHEEERTRVARELHDGAGQSLTALLMRLGNLEEILPTDADRARQNVADIEGMAAAVVEEIRRLMMDLRPALLDDLGLIPAISSYADAQLRTGGVKLRVEIEGMQRKLAPSAEIALFRIAQGGDYQYCQARGGNKGLHRPAFQGVVCGSHDRRRRPRVRPCPVAHELECLGVARRGRTGDALGRFPPDRTRGKATERGSLWTSRRLADKVME